MSDETQAMVRQFERLTRERDEARAAYTALLERVDFLKAQTKTLASECAEARAALAAEGERTFADFDALHDYLQALNSEGEEPHAVGFDRCDRPVIAWLIEEGGDCTWPLGLTLGGETAERPEPVPSDMSGLAYPVRIARTAKEARP